MWTGRDRVATRRSLMWVAIFVETRSETGRTRREPLFSSMENPTRALTVRR